MSKKSLILSSLTIFGIFGLISFVFAQTGPDIGLGYGAETGLASEDVRFIIANIIRFALGLLGIISLVIVIYAGFKWMTAGGNEENVKTAQKILTAAIIGLVIIILSYSIVRFVTYSLFRATKGYDYSAVEF